MSEFSESHPHTIIRPNHHALKAPLMYLSSAPFGWDDLTVQAYHEPMTIDHWEGEVVPEISIVLMSRGSMLLEAQLDDGTWRGRSVQEGDLFLRPGGIAPRYVRWNSTSHAPMETIHILLNNDVLLRNAASSTDCDYSGLSIMQRAGFQDPLLSQIGYALWHELENPSSVGKLYAQTAAQMIAVHLLRHYAAPIVTIGDIQAGLSRKQVRRLKDFIETNLAEALTLSKLAAVVGFSEYHFARQFRQSFGQSPHQYVLQKRVERAKHLLVKTSLPISDIAIETGFSHQSHLTHVFKRQLGLTPKAYRHQY